MKRQTVYIGIGLFLLPLFAAGTFILAVRAMSLFRYDPSYFTPHYQKLYQSPGMVASAIELALHNDNPSIFAELTGLRYRIRPPQANPDVRLMVLWKVTDKDYFQYLFFNTRTYHRIIYNIKQVDGRWVMVPRDPYYFLDSGDWLLFFSPAAAIWWSVLMVTSVGLAIYSIAARFREQQYRLPKN